MREALQKATRLLYSRSGAIPVGLGQAAWPWTIILWVALAGCWSAPLRAQRDADFLRLRSGYFWSPVAADYFLPVGFAYQTFNPQVGAFQSFEQLEYDLREFKKMQANSVRVEFVWNTVETAPGVFDWSKPDFLVAKAQEFNLRLFVLIGYQYAPSWFPTNWMAWKSPTDGGTNSVVLAYENPFARQAYSNYIAQVTTRYKNVPAIAAWILGNEYAYYDLWDSSRRFVGFDPYSLASFRAYLADRYTNDLSAANANWRTQYARFEEVSMPQAYPSNRDNPLYYDLTEWRKNSIGEYVALGARAARLADPNHLITYSMVGGLFGEADVFYTCEDAGTIVRHCADAGAPLDFWSINNYAIATMDSELRSVDYGIGKHQAGSGLPVLVTETGHTSTEDLFLDASSRQASALPTEIWASLMSAAIGVHVFTWNDRDLFSGNYDARERGFGIVAQTRQLKSPVYENVAKAFLRVQQCRLNQLLGGSTKPAADVQFFWSAAGDMGWCRANHENYRLWSTLNRLGYRPEIIDDEQFDNGAWRRAPALVLSRCFEMEPGHLDEILTQVIPAGIHVYANADLPGQFDAYHYSNPNWPARMTSLFGLDVTTASAPWDAGATSDASLMQPQALQLKGVQALGSLPAAYKDVVGTWKLWQGLSAVSGTIVTDSSASASRAVPALQIQQVGGAKTAINTFAIGDISNAGPSPPHTWDLRYQWLRAIFRDWFGLAPAIDLSGSGASYVYQNYRICSNGSVLLGLLNGSPTNALITVTATNLLAGRKVENLTDGGILASNSTGSVSLSLAGDQYSLLYAYPSHGTVDGSLVNSNPNKLWITSAPQIVWPTLSNSVLTLGYDLQDSNLELMASFERVLQANLVYAQTNAGLVAGAGTASVALSIPDADLNDPWYTSTPDGGDYVFHAWLVQNGTAISDAYLPVRLLWAARPLSLPGNIAPGASYPITVEWQELPSWLPAEGGLPLDRARVWQPYLASQQYYNVLLELRSDNQVIASQEFLTNMGTDEHTFNVTIPPDAKGPFTWYAYLQSAPDVSVDLIDSFEDRDPGAGSSNFAPWQLEFYASNSDAQTNMFLNAGVANVVLDGGRDEAEVSAGLQSVFVVCTNPPAVGSNSGSFLFYNYPAAWALPHDSAEWSNYTFAFDFRERNQRPSVLELQVKDARGGEIHFTKPYSPSSNGWDTIEASLNAFVVPPWVGYFDSDHVTQLVVNVQLLDTNAQYQEFIDNIRFVGPKTAALSFAPVDVWDNFNNRDTGTGTAGASALMPWTDYVYPPSTNRQFDHGIVAGQGVGGGQAAFLVVTNPAGILPPSVFGLYQAFQTNWALPADTNRWRDYEFSYSFREANQLPCLVEMQVKSDTNNWIEFSRPYHPGSDGWDRVEASIAEFVQPQGIGLFDPANVRGIAVNVRMLETNALYVGFFDNIDFRGPTRALPGGTIFGLYDSSNDSAPVSPEIYSIVLDRRTDGAMTLSWPGRTNRLYTVEHQDWDFSFSGGFSPLEGFTSLRIATNGLFHVTDTNTAGVPLRFYRLAIQPRPLND
jgi:hypothetical protein